MSVIAWCAAISVIIIIVAPGRTVADVTCPAFSQGRCACGDNATCPATRTSYYPCPTYSHLARSPGRSMADCACDTGRYGFPQCQLCPLNSYCPSNATAPIPCPASLLGVDPSLQFTTSQMGSTAFSDCKCPYFAIQSGARCVRCVPGTYILNSTCAPCPPSSFCPGDGSAWPCSRWSACPAGSAGVGLVCANNSFFEPNIAPPVLPSLSDPITATAGGGAAIAYANGTAVAWNGTAYVGGGACALDDGLGYVSDLAIVAARGLFAADSLCGAVRSLSNSSSIRTLARGLAGVAALVAMPNGLLGAGGANGRVWAVNPATGAATNVTLRPAPDGAILSLGVVPASGSAAFTVLVATDQYVVHFYDTGTGATNWTRVDLLVTPTLPRRIAFAGSVLYGDGAQIYQLSAGNQWVNLLVGIDLGPRLFERPVIAQPFASMDWSPATATLVLGLPQQLQPVPVCNPCPPNSTTLHQAAAGVIGLSRCQCAPGSFMGRGGCQPCPQGAYCPGWGTVDPVLCPQGHYCAPGAPAPSACDPSVFCAAGSWDRYGHGPNSTLDGALQCGVGYYLTGNLSCSSCPDMSSTAGTGATSVADCVCASAQVEGLTLFTFLNTTSGQCQVCPATYYCPVGCYLPLACPPGTYCHAGVAAPQTCPVGFYCPGGLPDPVPCAAGTFCGPGSSLTSACPPAFYCPREATNPIQCPAGAFCPTASGAPAPCPLRSYCGANASTPTACPAGAYCPPASPAPTPCPGPSSSLSSSGNLTDCFCIESFYGPGGGLCGPCPTGAYSPPGSLLLAACACDTGFKLGPDLTQCVACGSGEYCPGGTAPSTCPAGFVCSARWATPCPAGSYCPVNTISGLAGPVLCPPGGLCVAGAATYEPCPAGSFCPGNTSAPEQCPPGHYCPTGTGTPVVCRAGTQCAAGSVLDAAVPCSAGRYCPAGTGAVGVLCPGGGLCAAGASAPAPCPAGRFCPSGSAGATPCPRGAYCVASAANFTACPPGAYCPTTGLSAWLPCPADSYCPFGSRDATPCPLNSTSNASMGALADCWCDPGFEQTGNTSLTWCAPCAAGTYNPDLTSGRCAPCATASEAGAAVCPPPPSADAFPVTIVAAAAAGAVVVVGAAVGAWASFGTAAAGGGGGLLNVFRSYAAVPQRDEDSMFRNVRILPNNPEKGKRL